MGIVALEKDETLAAGTGLFSLLSEAFDFAPAVGLAVGLAVPLALGEG